MEAAIDSLRGRLAGRRPILVTGSQRSGTTWVGRVLTLAPALRLVHEPFNPLHRERGERMDHPAQGQFHRVTPEESARWIAYLEHRFRVGCSDQARRRPVWAGARPLYKDPIALLSADWMVSTLDARVIAMIRHPAAYVSSILRMNWRIDVPALALACRDLGPDLDPVRDDLEARVDAPALELLEEACLAWRTFACVVARLVKRHEQRVLLLRNEDLSLDPLHHFEAVHHHAEVALTRRGRDEIAMLTASSNPVDAGGKVHQLARDSRANVHVWRDRLDEATIATIRERTADVWPRFYAAEDWA